MSVPTVYAPSVVSPADRRRMDRWWRLKRGDEDVGRNLVSQARAIEDDQKLRAQEMLRYGSLYAGKMLRSLYQFTGAPAEQQPTFEVLGHRVTMNVAQSCVDTAAAKLSKNDTRVMFQTAGGDWTQRQRAKLLTRFVEGVFYEADVYQSVAKPAFKDAAIFDGGIAYPYLDPHEAAIRVERVFPFEVFVDEAEAITGTPRTLYRRKLIARDILEELYARGDSPKAQDLRAKIRDCRDISELLEWSNGRFSEMIPVWEAWHLPSDGKGTNGRHVIAIEFATLLDEGYDDQELPFPKYLWTDLPTGYWGNGIIAQVTGIQIELNQLLRRIQTSHHLASGFHWAVPQGSKVVKAHLDNAAGSMVEYAGDRPPQAFTIQALHPEIYQWVDNLYRKAFEIVGISQLSASAKKPEGLDAGVALREFHDIESERFVVNGQRLEAWHLAIAKRCITLARQAYRDSRDVRVRAPGTKLLDLIEWSRVDLREDAYIMKPFPASILPTTPAGRLQRVQELIQDGIVPREFALQLLDMPDLEDHISLQAAALSDLSRIIERILDDGEYEPPDRYMDLGLAAKLAHSSFLRARAHGAPPRRLEILAQFIEEAAGLQDELAQAAMPAPPPIPAGLPLAGPAPGAMPQLGAMPLPAEAGSPALPSALPV